MATLTGNPMDVLVFPAKFCYNAHDIVHMNSANARIPRNARSGYTEWRVARSMAATRG